MLKKTASIVLASLRGSTYRSVRLASLLAAALLNGLLSILWLPSDERLPLRSALGKMSGLSIAWLSWL